MEVVEAVRRFWPNMTPLRKLWRWRSPRGADRQFEVTLVYHVLASHLPHPHVEHTKFYVEMPSDADFPVPNQLDMELFRGTNSWGNPSLPGDPVRLDWSVYPVIRMRYDDRMTAKERIRRYILEVLERERVAHEKDLDELDYELKSPNKFFREKLAQISDVETREYQNYCRWAREQALKEKQAAAIRAMESRPVRFSMSRKDNASV